MFLILELTLSIYLSIMHFNHNLYLNLLGESLQTFMGTFVLADYMVLIGVISFTILLGVVTYVDKYKTQIYLPIVLAMITFLILKESQQEYFSKQDDVFLIGIIAFLSLLFIIYTLFLASESKSKNLRFEISTMLLLAFFGILLVMENSEGILIFVGLEIQAFTYYTLVSLADKNISSAEGALKYFLIGAMASGLFILGIGLCYGITGKTNLIEISDLANQQNTVVILGALLILIGLLFKIGAVPFHLWLPDAYEGAPFYILVFLISFPKISLFYLLFNVNNLLETHWVVLISLILSAMLGAIQAVKQTKLKRFIAYTIIFNNSFFLAMVLLTGKNAFYSLMESLIFYIIITVTTVITIQSLTNAQNKTYMLSLRDLLSLKKNNFFLSLVIMVLFFSAAGIPPLLGFFQKYIILLSLIDQFEIFIASFLIISSILPAFYYIRMPKNMYFLSATKHLLLNPLTTTNATIISLGTWLTLAIFY